MWKENHKEKNRIYQRDWRLRNKNRRNTYQRKYYAEHGGKEYQRKYYNEKKREWSHNYYLSKKADPVFQKRRLANSNRWRKKNKAKVYFQNRLRYRRLRGALGSHSFEEWEELKRKYNFTCPGCGRKEPEINLQEDHIIPLSKGGSNFIWNIQPLCGLCNRKKFNHSLKSICLNNQNKN